jgi:putative transcriptional regulator
MVEVAPNKKRTGKIMLNTTMAIYNRLKILIAEKEFREGRKWPYRAIAKETGISPTTLTKYINLGGGIDAGTLEKLCEFLDCQPGDLLVYSADGPDTIKPKTKSARK